MSHTEQMRDALRLASDAIDAVLNEMTVGDRFTNAGQGLIDVIEPIRAALTAPAAEVPEAMGDAPALPVAAHRGPDGTGSYFDSFTADQLRTYAKQYAQWQATRLRGGVPEGWKLVPVEPTPEMIEAARNVKRQRLVRAAADIKNGKHPDTIGMALSVNEEWTAMLTAAPQAPALDAGVVQNAKRYEWLRDEAVLFGHDDDRPSAWAVVGTGYEDANPIQGTELDAAIDAAMSAQVGGGK